MKGDYIDPQCENRACGLMLTKGNFCDTFGMREIGERMSWLNSVNSPSHETVQEFYNYKQEIHCLWYTLQELQ